NVRYSFTGQTRRRKSWTIRPRFRVIPNSPGWSWTLQKSGNTATSEHTMSLLETCVGIAIIAAFVIFAAPSLILARENYQLHLAARQVAGDMQWTRIKAISRSRDCRIRVTSNTSYVIECQDPVWQQDKNVTVPRGFQVTASISPEFHKRGNAA